MSPLQRPSARILALVLGVVTFLSFAVERFYWEFTGDTFVLNGLGTTANGLVFRAIAVATLVTVAWQALAGRGFRAAVVTLAGPLVGLGAFLVLHWAVFGPGTDSPTWLVYLALCGAVAVAGGVAHGVAVVARRVRNSRTAKPRL